MLSLHVEVNFRQSCIIVVGPRGSVSEKVLDIFVQYRNNLICVTKCDIFLEWREG